MKELFFWLVPVAVIQALQASCFLYGSALIAGLPQLLVAPNDKHRNSLERLCRRLNTMLSQPWAITFLRHCTLQGTVLLTSVLPWRKELRSHPPPKCGSRLWEAAAFSYFDFVDTL